MDLFHQDVWSSSGQDGVNITTRILSSILELTRMMHSSLISQERFYFVTIINFRIKSLGFGKSGIDWLHENTDFVGIGVDTLSIELGITQECYVHRSLTAKNKVRSNRNFNSKSREGAKS